MKSTPFQTSVSLAVILTAQVLIHSPANAVPRATGENSSQASMNGNGSSKEKQFPPVPSGWLTASPTVVQTGTKPTLKWNVNHPSIVENYITITAPSTIVADETVDCEIRVIGAGVTTRVNKKIIFIPTEATVNLAGTGYKSIFFATNNEIAPSSIAWSGRLEQNQTLKFGGQYIFGKEVGTKYNSDSKTLNVRTLVNGDTPPSNIPSYNAPSLESFIQPYLSATGKVDIGPMDCIIFMELTHNDSQMSDPGYDLQDLVLLVTFKPEIKAKVNNGHGNNIDGIDSSNPGQSPFINLDTDPTVDDER